MLYFTSRDCFYTGNLCILIPSPFSPILETRNLSDATFKTGLDLSKTIQQPYYNLQSFMSVYFSFCSYSNLKSSVFIVNVSAGIPHTVSHSNLNFTLNTNKTALAVIMNDLRFTKSSGYCPILLFMIS